MIYLSLIAIIDDDKVDDLKHEEVLNDSKDFDFKFDQSNWLIKFTSLNIYDLLCVWPRDDVKEYIMNDLVLSNWQCITMMIVKFPEPSPLNSCLHK